MGFRYEDAASQWWNRWALSAKASNSNSFELKCLHLSRIRPSAVMITSL